MQFADLNGQSVLDTVKKNQGISSEAAQKTFKDFEGIAQRVKKDYDAGKYSGGYYNSAGEQPTYKYGTLNTSLSKLGALTTGYGESTKYEKFHPAIDIANKIGTPIPNEVEGTVVSVDEGKKQGDNGYGNSVIIQDAQGNKFRYSHLNRAYVKIGQKIGKGQQLGEMGNTGSTYSNSGGTGSHLDFRVTDVKGNPINPSSFLGNS